jgi:identified by metaGeneAnnotator|nr:MAG TPA: tail assembly chaperone protein [Caudoviricetes sp.]
MALKTKQITIEHGRDKGRVFLITEMSAAHADNWAMRALIALANGGVDLGGLSPQQGMMGMARVALDALGRLKADDAIPLLNELLDCVQIIPEGGRPRPLNMDFNDVEDFTTLWRLRKEVFALHTDFLQHAFGKTTESEEEGAAA